MKNFFSTPSQSDFVARNGRPTIGMFNKPLDNTVQQLQWLGGVEAAQTRGVNLIYFPGDALHIPDGFRAQANVLYDFARGGRLDGLIIFTESLDPYIEADEMERFVRSFQPLPIVSVETAFDGIPSILMDNYQAMRALMIHIIEEHGYRRIAFIRGPEHHVGAQERYRAYLETLAEHGLPVDSRRISPPAGFADVSTTITVLLDERRLLPGVDFDAIVAVNDAQAIGAIEVLQARGIQVPGDVAVVGFDDFEAAKAMTPPITTVRPPFYEMGWQAVEMLLALLSGNDVPPHTTVPMELVIRQSCGCQSQAEVLVTAGIGAALTSGHDATLMEMAHAVGSSPETLKQAASLLESFTTEINGTASGAFLVALKAILRQVQNTEGNIAVWQNALSALRRSLLPGLDGERRLYAENTWQQARVVIGETAERARAYQAWQAEQQAQTLHEISAALISISDVTGMMQILSEQLPRLGIPGCYLSLYEYPEYPLEGLQLRLACRDHLRIDSVAEERRFPSNWFVPEDLLPQQRPYALVAEPLYFRAQQLGLAVFEVGPHFGKVYDILRAQLSSALQEVLLYTELRRYRDHLEELVTARTAELSRTNARLNDEITERTRAEHAVRVSEQQYRLLAENVQDGLLIMQQARIVFANQVFARLTGYAPEQILSADLVAFFRERDRQIIQSRLSHEETAAADDRWQAELIAKDGRLIWTEIEQTAIVWNNQRAFLLTIRDITARKLREQQLEKERARLEAENLSLKSSISERYRFGALVGKCAPMQRIYELIINAATAEVNVLVFGESGTGKELIARTLHQVSRRKAQAFVPVNCASIPETLFEREFFGHRKGAFTGADRDASGLFDRAHKGTLFLDEVTELTPATQAKLLRVLQDGEYTPLGSTTPKQADVVIVAATNKDCQEEIRQGRLRKDFFYRIGVVELRIPPLRDRKDDLPLLIEHILETYRQKQAQIQGQASRALPANQAMLPGELVQALYRYDWPGNVRELQNILQRYLATQDTEAILALLGAAPHERLIPARAMARGEMTLSAAVETFEKQVIADALAQNHYHVTKTAEILGVPRITLHRKIKKHRLPVKPAKEDDHK